MARQRSAKMGEPQPNSCPDCGKSYPTRTKLDRHLRDYGHRTPEQAEAAKTPTMFSPSHYTEHGKPITKPYEVYCSECHNESYEKHGYDPSGKYDKESQKKFSTHKEALDYQKQHTIANAHKEKPHYHMTISQRLDDYHVKQLSSRD